MVLLYTVNFTDAQPSLSPAGPVFGDSRDFALTKLEGFLSGNDGYTIIQHPYPFFRNSTNAYKKLTNFFIYHTDDNVQSLQTGTMEIPKAAPFYNFVKVFENETEFVSIYTSYDKNEREYSIYETRFDKNERNPVFNPKKIVSFEMTWREEGVLYTAASEDKSKHSFSLLVFNRKNEFKGIYNMVMNEKGEILWESTQGFNLDNKYFNISGTQVTNTGEMYLAMQSYDLNTRKTTATNTKLHLLKIGENEFEHTDMDIDFGSLKGTDILLTENGRIFIGGYYSLKYSDVPCGIFSAVFDPSTNHFSQVRHRHLEGMVEDKNRNLKQIRNSDFNIELRTIEQLENGEIFMLGEQVYIRAVIDQRTGATTYVYHLKSVFYHHFNADGEEISSGNIDKYQIASCNYRTRDYADLTLSFDYMIKGNDVYLIYTDNTENSKNSPDPMKEYMADRKGKNSCTVVAHLPLDGDGQKYIINTYDETKKIFGRLVYYDDNGAVLSFIGGKKISFLQKLTY